MNCRWYRTFTFMRFRCCGAKSYTRSRIFGVNYDSSVCYIKSPLGRRIKAYAGELVRGYASLQGQFYCILNRSFGEYHDLEKTSL